MRFTKMHGCGNDYIYVNCFEEDVERPNEVSKVVSERHFGIGADGLILIKPSKRADFKMAMYNADGTEGKMCGNGIRCVAKYVYDNRLTNKTIITVDTLSGIKTLKLNVIDNKVDTVKVDMGTPVFLCRKIPVNFEKSVMINEPVKICGEKFIITGVSMGNPHGVVFLKEDVSGFDIEKFGPVLESHSIFPEKANIEFVNVLKDGQLKMRVWERGSKETYACGTGACAAVAAAFINGYVEDKVSVQLKGGNLEIEYDLKSNHIFMTGPARSICTGNIDINEKI